MKKHIISLLVFILLCASLLAVYSSAAEITHYNVTVKQSLADYDSGSDATVNIEAGGSKWGARWADTTIGTENGLDGTAHALSVKIAEYSDGDGVILTGFECSLLGGSDTYNSWTAGKNLIIRIRNNTATPFNLTPALDVNDGADGRVRIWVNGAQQLLDTGFNTVDTKNVYALCSDGVSYSDRLCYTTIPGSFDGWMLIPLSDYAMGVGDFECISNDSFTNIDWTQVMHFTCMVQDASNANFTVDSVALADAAAEAVTEAAAIAETEAAAADAPAETAPATADFTAITMLIIAGAAVFTQYLLTQAKAKNKD